MVPLYRISSHGPVGSVPEGTCCACGCTSFIGEQDVMDTWMTSSLTPLINARWTYDDKALIERIYPQSIRVQAFEIIRTWLFYTVVKSHFHTNSLPLRDVMISGWGLDAKGKKMSKSLGNFVDPMDVHKGVFRGRPAPLGCGLNLRKQPSLQ